MKVSIAKGVSHNIRLTDVLKGLMFDKSTLILIVSNIITIFLAIWEGWNLITLMVVYWAQSVIIGAFTFLKIVNLKKFSTKNFRINGRPVEPTKATKIFTAIFFLIHYGFFHLGYLIFLLVGIITQPNLSNLSLVIILSVIASIGIFFINHLYSFLYNKKRDSEKVRNIGTIMFFPYARIIPMHLTIVSGFFLVESTTGLIFFLILKTIADVIMHMIEHKV